MRGVVGLFIGGRAQRMGGLPKGLLQGPKGLPIVEQHWRMAKKLDWQPVMVGLHPAYATFARERNMECLEDTPPGIGPLGGLAALLHFAQTKHCIALACDMPHVAFEDLKALALSPSTAAALVPRRAYWEPLFARYRPCAAKPALDDFLKAGGRSFQGFLEGLHPDTFSPLAPETLEDWDCFEDLSHGAKSG